MLPSKHKIRGFPSRRRREIYKFFECSSKIPSGLSAYKVQKLVACCFYIITQKTRDFSLTELA